MSKTEKSKLDLSAKKFVPRRKRENRSGSMNSGTLNTSIDSHSTKSLQTTVHDSTKLSSNSAKPSPQLNTLNLYKKLLYWEPRDANGSLLDEAYCIESVPSEFWQQVGDLNSTLTSFKSYFNVDF